MSTYRVTPPIARRRTGAGYPSLARIDEQDIGIVYEASQSHLVIEKATVAELLKPCNGGSLS